MSTKHIFQFDRRETRFDGIIMDCIWKIRDFVDTVKKLRTKCAA